MDRENIVRVAWLAVRGGWIYKPQNCEICVGLVHGGVDFIKGYGLIANDGNQGQLPRKGTNE